MPGHSRSSESVHSGARSKAVQATCALGQPSGNPGTNVPWDHSPITLSRRHARGCIFYSKINLLTILVLIIEIFIFNFLMSSCALWTLFAYILLSLFANYKFFYKNVSAINWEESLNKIQKASLNKTNELVHFFYNRLQAFKHNRSRKKLWIDFFGTFHPNHDKSNQDTNSILYYISFESLIIFRKCSINNVRH